MSTNDKARLATRLRVRKFREKRKQFDMREVRFEASASERVLLALISREAGAPVSELLREWIDKESLSLGYRVEEVQKMLQSGLDSDQILAHFQQKKADQT
jgi:hypothetical protein